MMDEHELKMVSYRAMTNNLIVKSTTKTLSGEEAMFKETALACFSEDLRVHHLLLRRNRENLERAMEDGTFDEITGGCSQESPPTKEP